jgi:hypothetical protein
VLASVRRGELGANARSAVALVSMSMDEERTAARVAVAVDLCDGLLDKRYCKAEECRPLAGDKK